MEVVVLTHKGGQRSDGSVSVNWFPWILALLCWHWGSVGVDLNYNLSQVPLLILFSDSSPSLWIFHVM